MNKNRNKKGQYSKNKAKLLLLLTCFLALGGYALVSNLHDGNIVLASQVDQLTNKKIELIKEQDQLDSQTMWAMDNVRDPQKYQKVVVSNKIALVTAYNPLVSQTDSNPCVGASGKNLCKLSGCAVANNILPLGSKVRINTIGICTVEDRLNARYNGQERFDLFMNEFNATNAKHFGVKQLSYEVL
jgi:3D (Asp-Asp-Asp) domain-containing protein